MSWFQFKRAIYPFSRRCNVNALLAGSTRTFAIDHKKIETEGFSYTFEQPLDRASMQTQLLLDKGAIRILSKEQEKQVSYTMFNDGLYHNRVCVAKPQSSMQIHSSKEKLYLGNHRLFDIDLKGRNVDMDQLMPVWFNLGQADQGGELISYNELGDFYLDTIEDLFAPKQASALSTGYLTIRSCFFKNDGRTLSFLPNLPNKIASGLMHVHAKDLTITFEWSKKELKRIVMHALTDVDYELQTGHKNVHVRHRKDHKSQQGLIIPFNAISLKKGEYAFFDQFRR